MELQPSCYCRAYSWLPNYLMGNKKDISSWAFSKIDDLTMMLGYILKGQVTLSLMYGGIMKVLITSLSSMRSHAVAGYECWRSTGFRWYGLLVTGSIWPCMLGFDLYIAKKYILIDRARQSPGECSCAQRVRMKWVACDRLELAMHSHVWTRPVILPEAILWLQHSLPNQIISSSSQYATEIS